jgi:hypothetical protein
MGKKYSEAICARDHTGEVPQHVLDALPENQGHPVRHRCAACAYEAGMNEAAEDIKNLVVQIRQLTNENERLKRNAGLQVSNEHDDRFSGDESVQDPTVEEVDDVGERDAMGPDTDLISAYPDSEFKNLTRSTIALLAYWRDQGARLRYLAEHLDAPDLVDAVLTPEFPTPSPSGKASFTDLLVESTKTAVGIEGKRTEKRYPTIGRWCDSENKRRVLNHWCSLIRPRAALPLDAPLESLVYQMIHRTASVCARPAERAIVLYQMFGSSHLAEYEADLRALVSLLQPSPRLEVWMHVVTSEETAEYATIERELRAPAVDRPAIIKRALAQGELFRFTDHPPQRISVGG